MQASDPVWSPDGGCIYFIDNTTNALMAIRPDSQDQQVAFQDASITMFYSLAWSPGG